MSFWIGVIFVCMNNECHFMRSTSNFFSESECKSVSISTVEKLKQEYPIQYIVETCVLVNSKDQI